jgi:adenine C2-methylase RlmN of 23S rRNA A2503 and tRNA A37
MKSSILDHNNLQEFAKTQKLQPFRIKQIQQEIFKNQNISFDDMTTLSKDLRTQLSEHFDILSVQEETTIENHETTKI